jgi:tetratricopeptide (TPR) repeat protein
VNETLFLSTVTKEFGALRSRLARFLARTKTIHVRHQDDFFHRGVKTLHALEEEVVKSDFVVHIIGSEPGWSPQPDQVEAFLGRYAGFAERFPAVAQAARAGQISATQWEAWLALYFGKRLYGYELPGRLVAGSPQMLHSQRLHNAHEHPRTAGNEDELYDEILGSLIERGLLTEEETKPKFAPSRITRHSPQILFGRDGWLDALDAAWANPTLHVYTLVAWGGVGKTSLVAHWVSQRMAAKGWPGVERYFDWSFYSQGTGESRQTSSDLFIQEALRFFDDPDPTRGSPWERGERLAGLIRRHRALLVLDGIEPLQYPVSDPQAGRLKDQALEALLQGLAADNPGLCLVTTREHLTNLENQATTEEQKLDKLVKEAAIALLRHLQIAGTEPEMEGAWKDAGGHALTLQLLGRFLADAHGGDIRHYKEVKFEEADLERHGRSAFKVMIAYERWLQSAGPERQRELALLRLTGLFDRPMSRDCLQALRAEPAIAGLTDALVKLKDAQWNIALKRLGEIDLLTVAGDAIDAHPLIREYFAKQLRDTQPAAFQAAHSRLFDHLCKTTPHRPDTLEGLQPLYEAVVHGCLAGHQQRALDEIYDDRILRGTGYDGCYSAFKLGAIGADLAAVAAFFDEPWSRVSPSLREADEAWLLNEAAFSLGAVGRLTEALQPMRAGLDMYVHQKNSRGAAVAAGNLSELEVTLGRLTDAVTDSRQAMTHADQSGDAFQRMISRGKAADALHQSGRRAEAGKLFAEAERMQKERQPEFDLLYSLQGFRYCDWLLAPGERAAWQALLRGTGSGSMMEKHDGDGAATACDEVERRGKKRLEWRQPNDPILNIALDHLTLARVGLLRAILSHPLPQPALDLRHVPTAVNGLRAAGQVDYLPRGLLTAALFHFVRGDVAAARTALDQAHEIAERGPMPLYLADIHLHRARLFRDQDELARARELIEQHGYGRRKEELEDAEAAARDWPARSEGGSIG